MMKSALRRQALWKGMIKLTLKKPDDLGCESMKGRRCISCGYIILKNSNLDPYLCSDCEDMLISDESRYSSINDV